MKVCKKLVGTVVTVTAIGTGVFIAAEALIPGSGRAAVRQALQTTREAIDSRIDDPVKLRQSLAKLAETYPDKIRVARQDLTDTQAEIGQLTRRLEESRLVVQLTQNDLDRLDTAITRGREASDTNPHAVVLVNFRGERLAVPDAARERQNISEVQKTHKSIATGIERDVAYLHQQERRLAELVGELETEYAEYQAKLYNLDVQIAAIERGDRMLETMEARQQRIDELSGYRASSLEQFEQQVAAIRGEQQDRFDALMGERNGSDYVAMAEMMLDQERRQTTDTAEPSTVWQPRTPELIEIDPDQHADRAEGYAEDHDDERTH